MSMISSGTPRFGMALSPQTQVRIDKRREDRVAAETKLVQGYEREIREIAGADTVSGAKLYKRISVTKRAADELAKVILGNDGAHITSPGQGKMHPLDSFVARQEQQIEYAALQLNAKEADDLLCLLEQHPDVSTTPYIEDILLRKADAKAADAPFSARWAEFVRSRRAEEAQVADKFGVPGPDERLLDKANPQRHTRYV